MFLRKSIFVLLVFLAGSLLAEEVTIIVKSIPANTPEGALIYIAGNFNGWNPGSSDYMLENNADGDPEIIVSATATISFKFTRGSWATVEGNANGGFLPNRSFAMGSADTLLVNILSWEDTGGTNSTAAENVVIMDNAFSIPQFNRTRRIWLYLPPDYETSGLNYPVLYMHDGQNLFDQATAFAGEWEVDETLNQLFDQGEPVPIVVGVDNGGSHRIPEYTPWVNVQYGGGDGDLYADFIVETLKPFIDQNYRTLPGREHTGVMGSSLGGLISFYLAHKYQDVFSMAGVFSPSFWFSDSVYDFASETGKQHEMRYFFMAGSNESQSMVPQMQTMVDTLSSIGFIEDELEMIVITGGQHNEALWRSQFANAYQWLFGSSATNTYFVKPNTNLNLKQYGHRIWLEGADIDFFEEAQIYIYNLNGQQVYGSRIKKGQVINLPVHLKGFYVARVISPNTQISSKIVIP